MAHKLKKVFLYTLPCIFLMSHIIFCDNASAVTTTYSLNGYSVIDSINSVKINCQIMDSSNNVISTSTNAYSCNGNATSKPLKMHYISSYDTFNFNEGDIYEFDILIWSAVNLSSLDGFIPSNMYSPASSLIMLEFSQPINNVFYNNAISLSNGTGGSLSEGNVYATMYHFVFKARSDTSIKIGFPYSADNFYWSGDGLTFRMINYNHYRLTGEGSVDQQNEINATNDSVQESESEGNTSQTDTDTATQSLMTAGANIISALTSAPATDCNINISTTGNSSAFTSAIGNLNLCSDVPSGVLTLVQGMVALVFTPIVLYYVYSILTLIYAQFKEYNS